MAIAREYDRWRFTHDQVLEIDLERRRWLRSGEGRTLDIARKLCALRGIGTGTGYTYAAEFFGWRRFKNAKQVGALAGLTPTPHHSGDTSRELGISKSGNRHVRAIAIEIAWGWLRHQPDSALTRWYAERFARGGPRVFRWGEAVVRVGLDRCQETLRASRGTQPGVCKRSPLVRVVVRGER